MTKVILKFLLFFILFSPLFLRAQEGGSFLDSFNEKIKPKKNKIEVNPIGHPNYSSKDIIGDCVNNSFLALHWISKNTQTGVGISGQSYQLLKKNYPVKTNHEISLPDTQQKQIIFELDPFDSQYAQY